MLPCVTEGSVVVKIMITGYTGEKMLMFLKERSDTVPTNCPLDLYVTAQTVC